jgi:hypothetical protein
VKGGYSVRQEAQGATEEFSRISFIYEYQGWSVFVGGVLEEEVQGG